MTQCFLFLKTIKFSDIVKVCSLKLLNQINFLFSLSQIHSHNVEHSKIKNETGLKIFKPKTKSTLQNSNIFSVTSEKYTLMDNAL